MAREGYYDWNDMKKDFKELIDYRLEDMATAYLRFVTDDEVSMATFDSLKTLDYAGEFNEATKKMYNEITDIFEKVYWTIKHNDLKTFQDDDRDLYNIWNSDE